MLTKPPTTLSPELMTRAVALGFVKAVADINGQRIFSVVVPFDVVHDELTGVVSLQRASTP